MGGRDSVRLVSMQDCPRKTIAKDSVMCPTSRCEDTCWLSAWSSWGACSRSCSGGKQTRTRSVVKKEKNGVCDSLVEERSCNEYRCAGDCVISTWSTWGECSLMRAVGQPDAHSHGGDASERDGRTCVSAQGGD